MNTDRYVEVNENGKRVGETHHRAVILNSTIDLIRGYREDQGKTYEWIALKLGIKKDTIAKICRYERRVALVAKLKKVEDDG